MQTWAGRVFAFLSAGADTKANTLGAGGALEHRDLGLLEDGSERGGALGSDLVVVEIERGHCAPLEPLAQLGAALSGVHALSKYVQAADLVAG